MDTTQPKLMKNAKAKTHFLSILTHWWTVPFFKLGYNKALDTDDLFEPLNGNKSQVLGDLLERYIKEQ